MCEREREGGREGGREEGREGGREGGRECVCVTERENFWQGGDLYTLLQGVGALDEDWARQVLHCSYLMFYIIFYIVLYNLKHGSKRPGHGVHLLHCAYVMFYI